MSVTINEIKKLRLHRNSSSNLTKKQAILKLKDKLLLPETLDGELISVQYIGSDNRESGLLGYRTKSNYVIFDGISNVQDDGSIPSSTDYGIEVKRAGDNFVIYQGGKEVSGAVIPANLSGAIKDFFLRNAVYNQGSKELELTVGDGQTNNTIKVSLTDLIKTYNFGDGLSEQGGTVDIKLAPNTRLSKNQDGLSVNLTDLEVKIGNLESANTEQGKVGSAIKEIEKIKKSLPANASENNKLVTQQDLQGFQPAGQQQPQVVPSNGATIGVVKGEKTDSYDVVTTNGNIKVKIAENITSETQLEDAIIGNMLRRSKTGGLYLANLWDRGEY